MTKEDTPTSSRKLCGAPADAQEVSSDTTLLKPLPKARKKTIQLCRKMYAIGWRSKDELAKLPLESSN